MDRLTQSLLLVLIGGVLGMLSISGKLSWYVRAGYQPAVLATAAILVLVGAAGAVLGAMERAKQLQEEYQTAIEGAAGPGSTDDDDGHAHGRAWVAWLLVLPVAAVMFTPPALGSDAVARDAGTQAQVAATPQGGPAFGPLPSGERPVMALKEFVQRTIYAPGTVADKPITVLGFVAAPAYGYTGGYSLARLVISCCAADALAMQLQVDGAAPFPKDTWVSAVVTAKPGTGTLANGYVPTVTVQSITAVPQPADPYEW